MTPEERKAALMETLRRERFGSMPELLREKDHDYLKARRQVLDPQHQEE